MCKDGEVEFVNPQKPYFNNLVMQNDNGDLWSYYESPTSGASRRRTPFNDPMPYDEISEQGIFKGGYHSRDVKTNVKIIEKGPIRTTVKVDGEIAFWKKGVRFTQYIHIYAGLKRIDFKTDFTPFGKHYRVRVCFPTAIKSGKIFNEIPFGIQERPEGEFPAQNWIDYKDTIKGLKVINNGLPGNNVTDGVAMISLFRSAGMEYKGESSRAYEEGIPHSFNYSIIPYLTKETSVYNHESAYPLIASIVGKSPGKLSNLKSYLKIKQNNILLSTIKMDRSNIIVRVYEAEGKTTSGEVTFSKEMFPQNKISIYETDCLYNKIKEIKMEDMVLKFTIQPFEIKTFILSPN